MAVIEDLIDDTGGMGRFQVLLTFATELCRLTCGWSMLQMSFARLQPDYHCLVENANASFTDNETLNVCDVNGTRCSSLHFFGSSRTATSEWSLTCDREWIQQAIISAQMVGVLVGALTAGQLSDTLGRKKILYSSNLFHIICNFIAAASTSWTMFCAMRFFIGIGIGSLLVVALPYSMEFLPVKWRPIVAALPTWPAGVSIFAAAAVVLDDWSHLHLACAIVSIPSLLGFFFVPESMRWLTVHGRLEEAEEVLTKMARWNNKKIPENTRDILEGVEMKQRKFGTASHTYSIIDIFNSYRQARISVHLFLLWFILSVTYYGISFGVASLYGNIFLNIFLLGVLEVPIQALTFCTNNMFGRRWSSLFFYAVSCLTTVACVLCYSFLNGTDRGVSINVLSMIVKTCIGSAWSCTIVWGTELYPTVTRNLGYAFSSSGARIAGILAPFIIRLDSHMALSYGILIALLLTGVIICLRLPETKGTTLMDSQYSKSKEAEDDAKVMINQVDESHKTDKVGNNDDK